MLELMARGGMRISEVLQLTPGDIEDRKLTLRSPKSGKEQEIVFIPQKVADRLREYISTKKIGADHSTTQRYLGTVSDVEAMRWIDNLYG